MRPGICSSYEDTQSVVPGEPTKDKEVDSVVQQHLTHYGRPDLSILSFRCLDGPSLSYIEINSDPEVLTNSIGQTSLDSVIETCKGDRLVQRFRPVL